MMRAFGVNEISPSAHISEVTVPKPEPGERGIVIRVQAASLNPVDWKASQGMLGRYLRVPEFPFVPGMDVAGIVDSVGPLCSCTVRPGDAVMAMCFKSVVHTARGGFAEYVFATEEEVVPKPPELSFEEAAAVPLAALTAWQALIGQAGFAAGQDVLLNTGAGGVGSYAVQIAKREFDARRIAVISNKKNHDYLRSLGADILLPRHEDVAEDAVRMNGGEGFAVVFDSGGEPDRLIRACAPGGIFLSCVGKLPLARYAAIPAIPEILAIHSKTLERGVKSSNVWVRPNSAQLSKIAALLAHKRMLLPKLETMPMHALAAAFAKSQSGTVVGKIVLSWSEP